jgi:hypothetical protein
MPPPSCAASVLSDYERLLLFGKQGLKTPSA